MRFVIFSQAAGKRPCSGCAEYLKSRNVTDYEWLRPGMKNLGLLGWCREKSRRAATQSESRWRKKIEQRVMKVRCGLGGLGVPRSCACCCNQAGWKYLVLIHPILFAASSSVKRRDRHRAALKRFERQRVRMSCGRWISKGPWDGTRQAISPLSVLRQITARYAIALAQTGSTRAEPVRERLQDAFERCGSAARNVDGSRHTVVEHMQAITSWTWLTV